MSVLISGDVFSAWRVYAQSLDALVVIDEPVYERLRCAFMAGADTTAPDEVALARIAASDDPLWSKLQAAFYAGAAVRVLD